MDAEVARAAHNRWQGFGAGPQPGDGPVRASLRAAPGLLLRPLRLLRTYTPDALRADVVAGATVGVLLLPQALAFSLLAGLPPVMGIYSAIVAAIAGALWGSSSHLHTGPTNTAAILTLSVLLPIAEPGSSRFIAAAGLIAVLAGGIRLMLGLARLGRLVNFVSDSVAVGFTAGAGILIISNQLEQLLRIRVEDNSNLLGTLAGAARHLSETHLPTLALGLATIGVILLAQRLARRVPAVLVGIVVVSAAAWMLGAESYGVRVLGELPQSLPPIAQLPLFDLELIGQLANGALALAIIGLVESVSIARAVAGHSRQRIDSNQEFVGQGLANIFAGIFSGYPCSGSFNRSALSYQSGAQTAVANAFSGLFLLVAMFALAPLATHLPRAVLAGALAMTAYGMIDRRSIRRIWRSARSEAVILLVTMGATLLLPLQFAVLAGVLMSLGLYVLRTSTPRVLPVVPDDDFRHWGYHPEKPCCPQLGVLSVQGEMYFGAVSHVEERIEANRLAHPDQRFLLLRMGSVHRCDISGIRALENTLRAYRERGGDLFFVGVPESSLQMMRASEYYKHVGTDHFLTQDTAIDYLFHKVIDPAVCIYECEARVFRECQNLPKRIIGTGGLQPITLSPRPAEVPAIAPRDLWQQLRVPDPPLVVDVREPREFRHGHVPGAQIVPLPQILAGPVDLPRDRRIVVACRSGRRSTVAAAVLRGRGYDNLATLEGGMLAWEAANLLEAIE
jgi:SulP family sulfate permease